ncbi:nitroreductase family protein [Chloroflexota bacterium]
MTINDFLHLVRSRRSYRRFKSSPVPPDDCIQKMLEAARWAMSGANAQSWEFIIIKDRDMIRKINEACLEDKKDGYNFEMTRVAKYKQQVFAFGPPESTGWEAVPVLIAIVGDRRTTQATVLEAFFLLSEGGPDAHYAKNMANATQNIHLAATAMGLATRWVSITQSSEETLKRLLDVPDQLDIHTIVPVGYPAYKPPPPYRRKLEEIVHYEKYDRSRYRSVADVVNFLADLRKRSRKVYAETYKGS